MIHCWQLNTDLLMSQNSTETNVLAQKVQISYLFEGKQCRPTLTQHLISDSHIRFSYQLGYRQIRRRIGFQILPYADKLKRGTRNNANKIQQSQMSVEHITCPIQTL